jgi:predicted nucleotide-binding protein
VFVVHGRDEQARRAMFEFLRALGLHPLDWEEAVTATGSTSPFLPDVVATAFSRAQAVVVLLTPDDVVYLHSTLRDDNDPHYETRPTGQARPNVLFEAGAALVAHPRDTVIVEIGRLRPFSDLGGRNVIRFDGSPGKLQKIAQRLRTARCRVEPVGSDWLDASRFSGLDAYSRGPGSTT